MYLLGLTRSIRIHMYALGVASLYALGYSSPRPLPSATPWNQGAHIYVFIDRYKYRYRYVSTRVNP